MNAVTAAEAKVVQIPVGMAENWAYLVACPRTAVAALVDPAWEVDTLLRRAATEGLKIEQIWLTHEHDDHTEGLALARRQTAARVCCHESVSRRFEADVGWKEGDTARLGGLLFEVWHTPGHAPGHVSLVGRGMVLCGDVLFADDGCGRADLAGGDPEALWRSLQRLAALPDETKVYCGHHYGVRDSTTIGHEKGHNPCLRCENLDEFLDLRMGGRRRRR